MILSLNQKYCLYEFPFRQKKSESVPLGMGCICQLDRLEYGGDPICLRTRRILV